MTRDDILYLIEYHNRANQIIFDAAAQLSAEQLQRADEFDLGTAFNTLRHIVDVDWSWREFCNGNDVGQTYIWDLVPMPDLAAVRAFWDKDHAELLTYVQSLDDAALQKEFTVGSSRPRQVKRWQILAHVVNHGTQHRSELARYFTECGHSPGDLSLI